MAAFLAAAGHIVRFRMDAKLTEYIVLVLFTTCLECRDFT
jgi:hypothetical protein